MPEKPSRIWPPTWRRHGAAHDPRSAAAHPPRDDASDRGRARRRPGVARRPDRRRGAARDPGGRPRPGPGRGRGHDAHPRPRGRAGGRLPAHRGPDRGPGGRRSDAPAIRPTLNQPDDTIVVRLTRPFDDSAVAERHFVATASCGICGKASHRRGRGPLRPAPRRAGRRAVRDPGPPGPAPSGPAGLRPDRRPPRRRAVHPDRGADRRSARTSAATTPSTSSSARRSWPGRSRSTIGSSWSAGGSASRSSRRRPSPASRSCAPCPPRPTWRSRPRSASGVTLVGFLRGDGFNVYSHDRRIDLRDLTGWG